MRLRTESLGERAAAIVASARIKTANPTKRPAELIVVVQFPAMAKYVPLGALVEMVAASGRCARGWAQTFLEPLSTTDFALLSARERTAASEI